MSTITLEAAPDLGTTLDAPGIAARRRRPLRRLPGVNLVVFGIYSVISLIADFPIWPGDPSRVPTMRGEDIYQTAWFLEWTPYALLHGKNLFETNALNAPFGVDLAQNTGMPLLGLVTAPLTWLVSPIASENLLRFFAFSLSAYAAYWVLRKFVQWTPAAFVGGLFYGFSPYMLTQGSIHLNLMFVPLPPLLLYALFELVVLQRTRPVRRGLVIGVLAVAQFFISSEVLATTALVAAFGLAVLALTCVREVPARWRHAVIGLGVAAIVIGVCVAYPTWIMFRGANHYVGPAQGYSSTFNADLFGAVLPTTFQLIAPHRIATVGSSLVGGQIQENGSYLGLPLLVLCAGIVLRNWRKLWPVYLAILAAGSWLLSLGARLIVHGHARSLPFSLPFKKLSHVPGLENILPVRFSLYVDFFVAILLAIGIDEARKRYVARRAGRAPRVPGAVFGRIVVGGVSLATVLALLPAWPYQSFRTQVNPTEQPRGLAVIPTGAVVLTYPYPTTFFAAPMLWQALDKMRFRLVGGYALVPGAHQRATIFPHQFPPGIVENMLVDSVSPVAVAGYPFNIATNKSITATTVTVDRDGVHGPTGAAATLSGAVIGVEPKNGVFFVRHGFTPIEVKVSPTTQFVERWAKDPSLAGIAPGEIVTVTGSVGPGTITPAVVGELRAFLRHAQVQAVVVGLGTTDGWTVAQWFTDALGPPTRAGGGAEIWTHVDISARHGA
jgi:hypothetical protein